VQALNENEQLYRDLVEHSHDLICTHDLNGVLLTVNLAAARTLGYEPAELVNRSLRELLSPKIHKDLDAYLASLKEKKPTSGFIELWAKNGEIQTWKYTSTLRTEGVEVPFVRAMAHDLTDILKSQKALRES
jgi:PAS domain S-box-containing protein